MPLGYALAHQWLMLLLIGLSWMSLRLSWMSLRLSWMSLRLSWMRLRLSPAQSQAQLDESLAQLDASQGSALLSLRLSWMNWLRIRLSRLKYPGVPPPIGMLILGRSLSSLS